MASRLRRGPFALLITILLSAVVLPSSGAVVLALPFGGEAAQSAEPPKERVHVVDRGETLFQIAERHGSTVDALAHANHLHDPTTIYVGQRLAVPYSRYATEPASTGPYVVQPADSLVSIAKRYRTTWRYLADLNALTSPRVLHAGQVIRVPSVGSPEKHGGVLHLLHRGETLLSVAAEYDVSPWRLISGNDWLNPRLVYDGQPLLIPAQGGQGLPKPLISVDVRPLPVQAGESVVLAARAEDPVMLSGHVFGRSIRFAEERGTHYGLVGVDVFAEPGLYQAALIAKAPNGQVTELSVDIVVEDGQFGYERIPASPSLLDPDVVAAEAARLDALRPRFTLERFWTGPFNPPCTGTVSSYFGTRRAYNAGAYTSYHAGVDLRGSTGSPVYAPAAGKVVLAEELTVRGKALVLDHGWGVLTGYWHLSSIEVALGQRVAQGDLVARIGNTGLSTGSHLHWEMWVGGVNVRALQWVEPFYDWPDRNGAEAGDIR